jgi:hypothetical protein
MNRRSLEKLRMDRRLAGRKGWISKADLAGEAEALPDASGKIAAKEAEPDPGEIDAVPPEALPDASGKIAAKEAEPDPGEIDAVPPEADPQISTGPDTA